MNAKELGYVIDILEAIKSGGEALDRVCREAKSAPSFHDAVVRKLETLESRL